MDVVRSCLRHSKSVAMVSHLGRGAPTVTSRYHDIVSESLKVRHALLEDVKIENGVHRHKASPHLGRSAEQPRVVIVAGSNSRYVSGLFATWMVRGIAVPLSPSYPDVEIEYLLRDSQPSAILCEEEFAERMRHLVRHANLSVPVQSLCRSASGSFTVGKLVDMSMEAIRAGSDEDGALMIYTSGTTGRPKGVLHTHGSIGAQVHSLAKAWNFGQTDRTLHCLPLHHVHGIVNALLLPLFVGGAVEMLPRFSVRLVWDALREGRTTCFMGVPTMYSFLSKDIGRLESKLEKLVAVEDIRRLRLWVCGSAACPLPLLQTWKQLSGSFPLERYGMTETGMILGNPLKENLRRPGTVGLPFPGMEVDIRSTGELFCRGRQLFSGYWGLPDATRKSFDDDGWFQTGDTADRDDYGYISLLGRTSSDIIKHKGYKISALHIESTLLQHQLVDEVCVFGVDDPDAGEKIVAAVCGIPDSTSDQELVEWCQDKLPLHQVPGQFIRLKTSLPRNAMGKVNKISLRRDLMHLIY